MEYESREGSCVVVGPTAAGERLQHFATHAFRERLGEHEGLLHVSARVAAADACSSGRILVNGAPTPGRHVVQDGDVVLLRVPSSAVDVQAEPSNCGTQRRGPPRMRLDEGLAAGDIHIQGEIEEQALNPAFCRYYRDEQQICNESEWSECEELLMQPLPLTLRLNRSSHFQNSTRDCLATVFGERAQSVSWMEMLGGALHVTPAASSHEADAGVMAVQRMAVTGELTLQEVASMLPAIALSPQPSDCVLDLCSAPGSKTCQILDMMNVGLQAKDTPCGFLIANDLRRERVDRVWSRAKCLPSVPLLISVGDASQFPRLVSRGYDRILADVPCSSDGTVRKDPGRLRRWSVNSALRNHPEQVKILTRGLRLLRPGGRLVYSTCSLDPLENEAVVQAALLAFDGEVSLVPAEDVLPPGLRWSPGLETWRVPDLEFNSSLRTFESIAEVPAELQGNLTRSLFSRSLEEAHVLGLRKCARILPIHGCNFGGFFVATLSKRSTVEDDTCCSTPTSEVSAPCGPLLPRLHEEDPAAHLQIRTAFGVQESEQSPWIIFEGRLVCLASPGLCSLQKLPCEASSPQVLFAGVPLFCREGVETRLSSWRICQEGAAYLASCATRRRVFLDPNILLQLLIDREMQCTSESMHELGCVEPGPILVCLAKNENISGCSLHEFWLSATIDGNSRIELLAPREILERCAGLLTAQITGSME